MKQSRFTVLFVLIAMMGMGILQSCSDDPASSNEQPPAIPDLSTVIPDFNYFNQQKAKAAAGENYNSAAVQAQTLGLLMQGFSAFPNSILQFAQQQQARLNNGVWEWSYSISEGNESFSIRTTAERTSSGVEWNSYLTYSGGQSGPAIENYRYMGGTVAEDGLSGVWNIYAFESDDVISFDWTKNSDTDSTIEFDLSTETETLTLTYTLDGPNNTITVVEGSNTTVIYWNTDTNTGYIDDGTERVCWDATLENTAC
ncbi:hypothetical protein AB2B38_000850 [Balneola sp. MJW-20]|uniref:hypothetical protein n=1 Tax=Gracilimonas aurantiaca TaxID=3234185 RepID=UPI003465AA60